MKSVRVTSFSLCACVLTCAVPADDTARAPGSEAGAEASAIFRDFPAPDVSMAHLSTDGVWPKRWSKGREAPGLVHVEEVAPMTRPRAFFVSARDDERARRDAEALLEDGNDDWTARVRGERAGSFVIQTRERGERTGRAKEGVRTFRCVSLTPDPHADSQMPARDLIVQTTVFSVLEPANGEGVMLGTALLMPGMFGTPEGTIALLASRLRSRGWVVVRMLAQPSRFSERAVVPVRVDEPGWGASWIARETTDRIAECAYASKAMLDELERIDERLRTLPRVALGASAGAITLPGVVALEPERYAACVLIGGGCDMVVLARESNYSGNIDALRVRWDREPTREEFRAFDHAYLRESPLDAFHASAALRGKHVLMIHASLDQAVPAPLGDVLWERLGRPTRDVMETGHEGLFLGLPASFERIADWLEEVTRDGEASGAGRVSERAVP